MLGMVQAGSAELQLRCFTGLGWARRRRRTAISVQVAGDTSHPPTTHTTHHSHAMQPSPTLYLLASYLLRLLRLYITCLLLFVMGEKRLVRKYTHLSTTLFMDI